MPNVRVRLRAREQGYEIKIGAGLLEKLGPEARRCLGPLGCRAAVISNPRVFRLYGELACESLRAADFQVAHWLMGDGERYKTLGTLERALQFLTKAGLERSDAVVALGGGVVGDLGGFAAAVYLRGIALIHVPTTLLAQIDAAIGGKTAVNTPAGKNLIGAFHQPRAVLIDTETLNTLPQREQTAGWCEAVKQGAAASRKLFDQTHRFLHNNTREGYRRDPRSLIGRRHTAGGKQLEQLIAAQCSLKASIVSKDEREEVDRSDRNSRRILNFGHTIGHALEAVTRYRRFRHGEAVGYGMLVAGEISKELGLLDASELELLRDAVRLCGPLPPARDLPVHRITGVLARDKKAVEGEIRWVLLERLGRARIVEGKEVSPRVLRAALRSGLLRGR